MGLGAGTLAAARYAGAVLARLRQQRFRATSWRDMPRSEIKYQSYQNLRININNVNVAVAGICLSEAWRIIRKAVQNGATVLEIDELIEIRGDAVRWGEAAAMNGAQCMTNAA